MEHFRHHHRIYKQLGDTARPSHWWKQGWFEHNPVQNNETVLGISPSATAPMSSMSDEAWEQQPCNAFSNAAFFEVSLQACKTASAWGQDWSKMFFFSDFFYCNNRKRRNTESARKVSRWFFLVISFSLRSSCLERAEIFFLRLPDTLSHHS